MGSFSYSSGIGPALLIPGRKIPGGIFEPRSLNTWLISIVTGTSIFDSGSGVELSRDSGRAGGSGFIALQEAKHINHANGKKRNLIIMASTGA